MDSSFRVLQQKEIYEFLQGDGKQDLVTYNGQAYGLPYLKGSELNRICRFFGVTVPFGGSRWTYVEALMQYAIDNDRINEMLSCFFALENFKELNSIPDMNEVKNLHCRIISAAIQHINKIIRLKQKELRLVKGRYYIVDLNADSDIDTPRVDAVGIDFIQDLIKQSKGDLIAGYYDGVVTKARTIMEESLIDILRKANINPVESGNIGELQKQVKVLRNMSPCNAFDKRINDLLNGLEKIVKSIVEMRNMNSDAHGVGNRRINIREKEARLIRNSAIIYSEYMLDDSK